MKPTVYVCLIVAMVLAGTGIANAGEEEFDFSTHEVYCFMWAAGYHWINGQNRGYAIRVEDTVEVHKLGVFDSHNTAHDDYFGLYASTEVGIFTRPDGELICSTTIPAGKPGTVIGEWRYVDVDPVVLVAGQEYMVVRWQSNGASWEGTYDCWPDMQTLWWWDTMKPLTPSELVADEFTLLEGLWWSEGTESIAYPTEDLGGTPGAYLGAVNFCYSLGGVRTEIKSLSGVKALFQ